MRARLYGMSISHPANAARLMLEHKGIAYDLVDVPPLAQAAVVRAAGFRGGTVPAIRFDDGRRVQGTKAIARVLDELLPDPPLFPADPDARRAVEAAEAWGEAELQPVPRRLLRWALRNSQATRTAFLQAGGAPVASVAARAIVPLLAFYTRFEDAGSRARIVRDLRELPAMLDRVDALIADGVLDGPALNAADFQIATTLRVMLAVPDLAGELAGRPGERLARRVWPDYPQDAPRLLPPDFAAQG